MKSKTKRILSAVSTVLVAVVVLFAVLLVGVRLIGLQVFTVLSGSMEPAYGTGSLIYVKKVDAADIKVGDVITFMLDADTVATHRVIEVIPDEEDPEVIRFRTKGDANDSPDGGAVHCKNVIGEPVMCIPFLGYVANYIQNPPGMYIAIAVGALLLLLVFLPVVIGAVTGFAAGKILRRTKTGEGAMAVMLGMLLLSAGIGFAINSALPAPLLNFMLIGMAYSAAFANMITETQLGAMMKVMNPAIGFAMIVVILNLAAPLDYHLVFGAGIYTAVYIIARAVGKYSGAFLGASVTHAPPTVKKYLGFTLLPHSGVSLVFTGIVVSVLEGPVPECASLIQGTIAAAAVINEIIAVFVAKKGFEWAGELHKAEGGVRA